METYTELKAFIDNPEFKTQRQISLAQFDCLTIDPPLVAIVEGFMKLPYCFTLQSCYGHFLYPHQTDPKNTEPLPQFKKSMDVDYRIAYIALCLENSPSGKNLFAKLKTIPSIDPGYCQLGCADWFWKRQVNSFIVQVEPERYKSKDRVIIKDTEARRIERVRNRVYRQLKSIIHP